MLAGPGTGKTHTLVGRIAYLIHQGVAPEAVLAVTFTRRAAAELEERLALALHAEQIPEEQAALTPPAKTAPSNTPAPLPLLAPQATTRRALPTASTLHALALEQWEAQTGTTPTLLDEETARRVFASANAHTQATELRAIWERITLAREKLTPLAPDDDALLAAYTRHKATHNLADYTDLLERWLAWLTAHPASSPWTHILVDEIQDLSPLQLRLIVALLPATGQGFFGIGDPDQSIYGFRGAHGKVHGFLLGVWPHLQVVALEENYRSPAVVLRAASALLAGHAVCGPLRPALQAPGRIHLFSAPTAESEAAWVAGHIRRLIGQGSHTLEDTAGQEETAPLGAGELSPGDIAVLVRMRSLAPVLQQALARVGIDASVPENEGFWKDARVLPLLEEANRRLGFCNPAEAPHNLPPGETATESTDAALRLQACLDDDFFHGPKAAVAWAGEAYFDTLFQDATAFKKLCAAFTRHNGWHNLLNWIHLQTDRELVRARSERVQIMSIHAAKGLEFRAVFLPALEEGIMPFAGPGAFANARPAPSIPAPTQTDVVPPDDVSSDASRPIEEERRLLYVGITRACQSLFLSHAAQRQLFGTHITAAPSRFLAALPLEDMHRSALRAHRVRKETQLPLF